MPQYSKLVFAASWINLRLSLMSHRKPTGYHFCRVSGSGRGGTPRSPSPSSSAALGHDSPAAQELSPLFGDPRLPIPQESVTLSNGSHTKSIERSAPRSSIINYPTPSYPKNSLSLKVKHQRTRKPCTRYTLNA